MTSVQTEGKVLYEVKNQVAHITLANEEKFNAIDEEVAQALLAALQTADKADDVRAVLLLGKGKAFSGGGDVGFFYRSLATKSVDLKPLLSTLAQVALLMKKMPKPIICAAQGAAAGAGFSLALLSDFCFAGETCRFIQAFVNIGLVPDTGSAYLLAKALGTTKATELMMTGRAVSAREGKELGFVYRVEDNADLLEAATAFAEKMAQGPTLAYGRMKEMLFVTSYKDFEYFLLNEKEWQDRSSQSHDFKEGVFAFIEKRKAEFKGE